MNVPTRDLVRLLGLVRLPAQERLTHKQRVTRMYKATLKTLGDWAIYRDVWSRAASQAQAIFRARQHEVNPQVVEQFCLQGEQWLLDHRHPDPYIVPYRPGGTLYQRNEPLPSYALKDSAYIDWEKEAGMDLPTETARDDSPNPTQYLWRDAFARSVVIDAAAPLQTEEQPHDEEHHDDEHHADEHAHEHHDHDEHHTQSAAHSKQDKQHH